MSRYVLLLFGLCIPCWVIGAIRDIQLFPGFRLFQAGLAMPMIAALLLVYYERGRAGIAALLRRTYDVATIKPRIWFLPILCVYPSLGFINYWIMRQSGADIPSPTFSLIGFLAYCTVFFMTFAEELGLSGYAMDSLQKRRSALMTGPQDNLQKAVPFYRPQITALAAVLYVLIVVYLWGPKTLARFRFARHSTIKRLSRARPFT